jgi:hypothetical protein
MVYIPAGEFRMGSNSGKSDARPTHKVYLDAFYIDIFETAQVPTVSNYLSASDIFFQVFVEKSC